MPFANGSISSSGFELSVVVLEVSISSLTELWDDNFGLLPDFFTLDFLEVTTVEPGAEVDGPADGR